MTIGPTDRAAFGHARGHNGASRLTTSRPSAGETQEDPMMHGARRASQYLRRMPKNSVLLRLLKKVQLQGGTLKPERGVLEVRRSEWQGAPTPQMGLFQQPARRGA
jgi:hypothetical protein